MAAGARTTLFGLVAAIVCCVFALSLPSEKIPKEKSKETLFLHRYPYVRGREFGTAYDKVLDCQLKELAFNHSQQLLAPSAHFGSIFDALRLGEVCGLSKEEFVPRRRPSTAEARKSNVRQNDRAESVNVYVDGRLGDNDSSGAHHSPLLTIEAGINSCRRRTQHQRPDERRCNLFLRQGYYFLNDTIRIDQRDSGITISSYDNERAILSGGKVLKTDWQNYERRWYTYEGMTPLFEDVTPAESTRNVKYFGQVSSSFDCQQGCMKYNKCTSFAYYDKTVSKLGSMCYFRTDGLWNPVQKKGASSGKLVNIYVADLSGQTFKAFTSLFVNGKRAVRARFPNGDPETTGVYSVPNGYISNAAKWLPPQKKNPAVELHLDQPSRSESLFSTFQIGIGGPVSSFNPPKSYWGTAHPSGGGGATYHVPSGLQYQSDLEFAKREWKKPSTGIVHAFQSYYWGNWQFRIDERNMSTNTLTWSYGGFQEARGSDHGAQWYVENIFEELDVANEWYFDEETKKLYFFPNGTAELPSEVIAPQVKSLISVIGTKRAPVSNVNIHGVTLTQTATTFMDDYEVPSGGDWAVHRDGTVFLEGTENAVVDGCILDSPGGNGIFLSNYNSHATISNNELFMLGDNGIVLVGSSELLDGTDGNQPRNTKILANIVRNNGVWGKQTYATVQSLACETHLEGNVFFNGPRGGMNFNDGFGGGNHLERNLLFNFVRETKDHGPINSWDRQPYLTRVRDGSTASLLPKENLISRNFVINNYQSTWPIDHDDGSCYWTDSGNLLVYGGFKNYLGHSKHVLNNFYIYPDMQPQPGPKFNDPFCAFTAGQSIGSSGYGDAWTNNICVVGTPLVYGLGSCQDGKLEMLIPYFAGNKFYTPQGNITIDCGHDKWSLEQFQARGFDIGSVATSLPTTDEIIAWSKKFLKA